MGFLSRLAKNERKLTKEQSTYLIVVGLISMESMLMSLIYVDHGNILLKRLSYMMFVGFLFNQTFHSVRWQGASKKLLYSIGFISLVVFVVIMIMPF